MGDDRGRGEGRWRLIIEHVAILDFENVEVRQIIAAPRRIIKMVVPVTEYKLHVFAGLSYARDPIEHFRWRATLTDRGHGSADKGSRIVVHQIDMRPAA